METRRTVLKSTGAVAASGVLGGCLGDLRGGGDQYQMILGHATQEDAQDEIAQTFVDEVERLSDGQIETENHPGGALGDNEQMNEDVRTGAQQAIAQPAGFSAAYAPSVGVLDLPFLFPGGDLAFQTEVLNTDAMDVIEDDLRDAGVEPMGWFTGGFKHLVTSFPVESIGDLEGREFRVIQSPILIAQFEAWNAVAVGMGLGEVYSGLEQGVIEGIEMPPDVTNQFSFQEVTEQFTITNHGALSSHLMVTKEWFDSLPDDLQSTVVEAGENAVGDAVNIVDGFQSDSLDNLRSAEGFEVTEFPEDELDTMEEMSQAAWDVAREDDTNAAAIDDLVDEIESRQ